MLKGVTEKSPYVQSCSVEPTLRGLVEVLKERCAVLGSRRVLVGSVGGLTCRWNRRDAFKALASSRRSGIWAVLVFRICETRLVKMKQFLMMEVCASDASDGTAVDGTVDLKHDDPDVIEAALALDDGPLRMRGGKGGFGSMLRAQGGRLSSQKTTNLEACRDSIVDNVVFKLPLLAMIRAAFIVAVIIPCVFAISQVSIDGFQVQSTFAALPVDEVPLLPEIWEVLGPFAVGARELGVDPLSAYGGFEAIPYSETDKYPSELADEGFVKWMRVETNADQTVGPVVFPNVRWDFNQDPFGWTSLHHAIYFRGQFHIPKSGVYLTSFESVVSYKIDDRAFVGNVYNYDHASSSAIYLEEGSHTVFVCSIMDVRLFGGFLPPKIKFSGSFVPVSLDTPNRGIIVFEEDSIIPEMIGGDLITRYLSLTVLNANVTTIVTADIAPFAEDPIQNEQSGWVQILDVRAEASDGTPITASISVLFSLKLAPGQIYPLPIELELGQRADPDAPISISLYLDLFDLDTMEPFSVTAGHYDLKMRQWGDVYKLTFLDYDSIVHYTMARPPLKPCSTPGNHECPVVLALHGAGVEASSEFWTDAYRRQEFAWTVFPTGRTPWGFDWHGPSFKNVDSALLTVSHLHGVPEELAPGLSINLNKLVYTGHSNGGQGAWWMTSHHPDRALAAIPASGYLKIQFYTPYYMRVGDAHADPVFRGLMESSIAENDVDMYAANMAGIPILARTGGNDDNVPPLNTRRIVRLVNEWNRDPNSISLSEVPGQGHWFAGVVNDDELQKFLDDHLDPAKNPGLPLPQLPEAFTISTLNPGSTGSKGGIKILQLEVPYRLATIRVHRNGNHWMLNTTNVRRFGFMKDDRANINSWSIDGMTFPDAPKVGPSYLRKEGETEWKLTRDLLWISQERYSSTYGPASQILNHPFLIVIPSQPTVVRMELYRRAARYIASSWYLYGRGGTQIVRDVDVLGGIAAKYHLIVLGGPLDNQYTRRRESEGGAALLKFLDSGGVQIDRKKYEADGTGFLFLAPSPTRTLLGLFVAGVDELGFRRALWTIPFRTGLMVPDYMVVGDEYGDPATGWTAGDGSPFGGAGTKGAGGVFAAGYWSNLWEYDPRCGYTK